MPVPQVALSEKPVRADEFGGVQAVDTAVRVLSALIDTGGPLMLKTVAERAGMQPPKAHRYLVSLVRSGLAERDAAPDGYKLGPLAVRLGLAAVRHLDVVRVASPALARLRDQLGHTVALAVWGASGPTFVRFEESNDATIINGRPGSVMPMLSSSTGRVFGAYLPRSLTGALIARELAGVAPLGATPNPAFAAMKPAEVDALFEQVRQHRMARVQGDLTPGLHGLSSPIFDHAGAITGVVTVIESVGLIDTRYDGPVATALSAGVDEISRHMGWSI